MADQGSRGEPAHYDPNTHTIRIYRKALDKIMNTIDAAGADFMTLAIAHELGHAVDYESFATARLKVKALRRQLEKAQLEAKKVNKADLDAPLGDDKKVAEKKTKEQQEIRRLAQELTRAQADLTKAQTDVDTMKGGAYSQSREFTQARGKAISSYGERGKNLEDWADLFALFVLDPALLKSLRPDAYQYFSTLLP